jgi:hypothetical protein
MFTNSLFYCVAHSAATQCTPIDTQRTPIDTQHTLTIARTTQDFIGCRDVQLFYYENFGGFLMLPLVCDKSDTRRTPITPRGTPATTGSRRE